MRNPIDYYTLSHDSGHKSRSEIIDSPVLSPQSCEGQGDADYP